MGRRITIQDVKDFLSVGDDTLAPVCDYGFEFIETVPADADAVRVFGNPAVRERMTPDGVRYGEDYFRSPTAWGIQGIPYKSVYVLYWEEEEEFVFDTLDEAKAKYKELLLPIAKDVKATSCVLSGVVSLPLADGTTLEYVDDDLDNDVSYGSYKVCNADTGANEYYTDLDEAREKQEEYIERTIESFRGLALVFEGYQRTDNGQVTLKIQDGTSITDVFDDVIDEI